MSFTLDSFTPKLLKKMALGLGFVSAVAMALPAQAYTAALTESAPACGQIYCDYFSFTSDFAVSDIVRFNVDNNSSGGLGWVFSASQGTNDLALGYGSPNGINNVFFMGLATGLPGDTTGQEHVVLFTNSAFAASAQNIAWGTLFPNTSEATLINDLQTSFAPGTNATSSAINDLTAFGYGSGDAVTGPNGAISFTPNSSFSLIAFSNGAIIGSGTSVEGYFPVAVPEPEAGALMLAGSLMVVGIAARRARAVNSK